ncbi:hypothetical protein H5410_046289 [Solanum commersonii]|uniref:Uncharacterized protein n=1 Tax=Solanum commersonii TaxID=4109 RepID=A0A9J5XE15_SOLCO|nr:hypothetical protein H5410_046289 [Solanum commersonii]
MSAFKNLISLVDPSLCSHTAILTAKALMVVFKGITTSVRAVWIIPGIAASKQVARRSAERAICPIRSREVWVSEGLEIAAEEPGVSVEVAVVMDIPEGLRAGASRSAFVGVDLVVATSVYFFSA